MIRMTKIIVVRSMSRAGQAFAAAAAMAIIVATASAAVTIPVTDPTYNTFGDATTLNFQVLSDAGVIVAPPNTPQNVGSEFIRIFTKQARDNTHLGASLTPAVEFTNTNTFDQDGDGSGDQDFNYNNATIDPTFVNANNSPSSRFWYGLAFTHVNGGGNPDPSRSDTVVANSWATGDEILTYIQSKNPGSTTPLFALDMNQSGDAGLWLKGRVLLIDPSNLAGSITAKFIDDNLSTWILGGTAAEFKLFDEDNLFVETSGIINPPLGDGVTPNAIPLSDQNPSDDEFVYLPDVIQGVNTSGSDLDWGAFIPSLDLNDYKDWAFLVELQIKDDTNGFEDYYIIGGTGVGVPAPGVAAAGLALLMFAGARSQRDRRASGR